MEKILASHEALEAVPGWARRLVRGTRGELIPAAPHTERRELLDLAIKREVDWLVTGWEGEGGRPSAAPSDDDLAFLLGRAPCPVLTIQPWARAPLSDARLGVVGVNEAREAREAAHAAARLLRRLGAPAKLVLVHGCATHPAELAAKTPWSLLSEHMQLARHPWIRRLADELRAPQLSVDVVVQLAWAPDLIGGVAQRADADFTALGMRRRSDGSRAPLGRLYRRMVRGAPCAVLTAAPRRVGL